MDDARGVRLGERLAGLEDVLDGRLRGHRPARAERVGEVAARQVLHHHVRRAGLERPDVGHARHVLALDLHRGARLAQEALGERARLRRLRQQQLDRDPLLQLEVGRGDDDAHPAGADHPLDAVLPGDDLPRSHQPVGFVVCRRGGRHALGPFARRTADPVNSAIFAENPVQSQPTIAAGRTAINLGAGLRRAGVARAPSGSCHHQRAPPPVPARRGVPMVLPGRPPGRFPRP